MRGADADECWRVVWGKCSAGSHDMVVMKTAKKTESAVDQRCGLRTAWSGPRHCALIQQSTLICKPTHTVRLVQSDAIEHGGAYTRDVSAMTPPQLWPSPPLHPPCFATTCSCSTLPRDAQIWVLVLVLAQIWGREPHRSRTVLRVMWYVRGASCLGACALNCRPEKLRDSGTQ